MNIRRLVTAVATTAALAGGALAVSAAPASAMPRAWFCAGFKQSTQSNPAYWYHNYYYFTRYSEYCADYLTIDA